MNKRLYTYAIVFLHLLCLPLTGIGQTGGMSTYAFLNLSNSSRMTALGSNAISLMDNDLGLAVFNPSLITPQLNSQLQLSLWTIL